MRRPPLSQTTHGVSLDSDQADSSACSGAALVATAVSLRLISIAVCRSRRSCPAMVSKTHLVTAMNGVSSGTISSGTSTCLAAARSGAGQS